MIITCVIYILNLVRISCVKHVQSSPRFINEYGSVREIGIAPSCKTAGELIVRI